MEPRLKFVLSSVLLLTAQANVTSTRPHHDAYERLRSDLSKRPVVVHKMPAWLDAFENVLNITAVPVDILNVNDIDQVMTVIIYLQFTWPQPDLAWNETEFEHLDTVLLDTESLWHPLVYAIVGTGDSLELEYPDTLEIDSHGDVTSRKQYELTFRCMIDFAKYPFDTQQCRLGFHVLNHPEKGMDIFIQTQTVDVSRLYEVSGEWLLVSFGLIEVSGVISFVMEDYPVVVFVLSRRPAYYVITVLFPLVLTSLMIPLVFLIPSSTGEKISYLVAIFTSTAIFLNFICNVMPRGLRSVPYLAVFLIEVLVEGWLAMLASLAVVKKFYYEQQEKKSLNNIRAFNRVHAFPVSNAKVDPKIGTPDRAPDRAPDFLQRNEAKNVAANSRSVNCNLSSDRLDLILFVVFTTAQIVFLIMMFGMMDWI